MCGELIRPLQSVAFPLKAEAGHMFSETSLKESKIERFQKPKGPMLM